MRTHAAAPLICLALAPALWLLGGCREPTASPEQVVSYIESARAGAPVRRLWPAGQAYVNSVLAADAGFREAAATLLAAPTDYFAPASQEKAPTSEELRPQLEALRASMNEESVAERAKELDALREAVERVPEGWFPAGDARRAYIDSVWDALRIDGVDVRQAERELAPAVRANILVLEAAIADPTDGVRALRADVERRRARALASARAAVKDAEAQLAALRSERAALKGAARAGAEGQGHEDELRALDDAIDRQLARRRSNEDGVKRLEKPLVWGASGGAVASGLHGPE